MRQYAVAILANSTASGTLRAATMSWTNVATGAVATATRSCGSIGVSSVAPLAGLWRSAQSGVCASVASVALNTNTTIAAPASAWFGADASLLGSLALTADTACTATVNLLATPLAYRLVCAGNGSVYLGSLFVNAAANQWTANQNALPQSLSPLYPAAATVSSASVRVNTFANAYFVGALGCVAAPLSTFDIYGTSAAAATNASNSSVWADETKCTAFAAVDAQTVTSQPDAATACTSVWSYAIAYNGPHTVVQTCNATAAATVTTTIRTFAVLIVGNASGRPSALQVTDTATGFVSTHTRGCGPAAGTAALTNVTAMNQLWMNPASGACVRLASTATALTAPAAFWFNQSSSSNTNCTAAVNFLSTPFSYVLTCAADGSVYLGNLYIASAQSFSVVQNLRARAVNPAFPAHAVANGTATATVSLTLNYANFVAAAGVAGCIAPPLSVFDLYALANSTANNATSWAGAGTCYSVTAVNETATTFVAGGAQCYHSWSFRHVSHGGQSFAPQ